MLCSKNTRNFNVRLKLTREVKVENLYINKTMEYIFEMITAFLYIKTDLNRNVNLILMS